MNAAGNHVRCMRPGCGRLLRSPESIARGYGPRCMAKIRAAAIAEAVKGFAAHQIEKARQLIADGGIVATSRKGVFRTVSKDGQRTYLTHSQTCNCASGLHRLTACTCNHSLAARIMLATRKAA